MLTKCHQVMCFCMLVTSPLMVMGWKNTEISTKYWVNISPGYLKSLNQISMHKLLCMIYFLCAPLSVSLTLGRKIVSFLVVNAAWTKVSASCEHFDTWGKPWHSTNFTCYSIIITGQNRVPSVTAASYFHFLLINIVSSQWLWISE